MGIRLCSSHLFLRPLALGHICDSLFFPPSTSRSPPAYFDLSLPCTLMNSFPTFHRSDLTLPHQSRSHLYRRDPHQNAPLLQLGNPIITPDILKTCYTFIPGVARGTGLKGVFSWSSSFSSLVLACPSSSFYNVSSFFP